MNAVTDEYTQVSFCGAGIAGIMYPAAFSTACLRGAIDRSILENSLGTSSGAIMATGVAFNLTHEELSGVVSGQDYRAFLDTPSVGGPLRNLLTIKKSGGLLPGDEIKRMSDRISAIATGQTGMTFAEFQEYREQAKAGNLEYFEQKFAQAQENLPQIRKQLNDKNFNFGFDSPLEMMARGYDMLDLHMVATELQPKAKGRGFDLAGQVFDVQNTPEIKVSDALRASCSFPGLFENHKITFADGKTRTYTDGAAMDVLPTGEQISGNSGRTLAFAAVDSSLPPAKDTWLNRLANKAVDAVAGKHSSAMLAAVVDQMQNLTPEAEGNPNLDIVKLDCTGVHAANLLLPEDERQMAMRSARQQMNQWVDTSLPEAVTERIQRNKLEKAYNSFQGESLVPDAGYDPDLIPDVNLVPKGLAAQSKKTHLQL